VIQPWKEVHGSAKPRSVDPPKPRPTSTTSRTQSPASVKMEPFTRVRCGARKAVRTRSLSRYGIAWKLGLL